MAEQTEERRGFFKGKKSHAAQIRERGADAAMEHAEGKRGKKAKGAGNGDAADTNSRTERAAEAEAETAEVGGPDNSPVDKSYFDPKMPEMESRGLDGIREAGAMAAERMGGGSRVVDGAGGYKYEQFSDGTIKVTSPAGKMVTVSARSQPKAWAAIVGEIGGHGADKADQEAQAATRRERAPTPAATAKAPAPGGGMGDVKAAEAAKPAAAPAAGPGALARGAAAAGDAAKTVAGDFQQGMVNIVKAPIARARTMGDGSALRAATPVFGALAPKLHGAIERGMAGTPAAMDRMLGRTPAEPTVAEAVDARHGVQSRPLESKTSGEGKPAEPSTMQAKINRIADDIASGKVTSQAGSAQINALMGG